MAQGKLAVISGFSGAGKGTVIRRLMEEHGEYVLSVSMTTRSPREGETDGVEYHFVSNEAFEALVRQDGFLEHAGYVDHYYGTPRAFAEENLQAGKNVLLEIEVQGAMQIRRKKPEAVLLFVSPPDAAELEKRLTGRGTNSKENVTKRLRRALEEAASVPEYPFLVINEVIDDCADSLHGIISGTWSADMPPKVGGRVIVDPLEKEAFARAFGADLAKILRQRES